MEKIDQDHCPSCRRKFDTVELAVHMDARGPSYSYCACSRCEKAWEMGQLKRGSTKIGRRETKYSHT